MSESMVQLYILIAAWCGPAVSNGNVPASKVEECRKGLIVCIEQGGKERCFKEYKYWK